MSLNTVSLCRLEPQLKTNITTIKKNYICIRYGAQNQKDRANTRDFAESLSRMRWSAAGPSGDIGRLQSPSLAECADNPTIVIKYSLESGSGVGDVLCFSEIHLSKTLGAMFT